MKLRVEARISSESPDAVRRFLVATFGATSVTRDGSDWIVRAEVESASARDANRELLSELPPRASRAPPQSGGNARAYPELNGRTALIGQMILRYQCWRSSNIHTIRWRCRE